jgi:hypothetical protein
VSDVVIYFCVFVKHKTKFINLLEFAFKTVMGIFQNILPCGCVTEQCTYSSPPDPPYVVWSCLQHRIYITCPCRLYFNPSTVPTTDTSTTDAVKTERRPRYLCREISKDCQFHYQEWKENHSEDEDPNQNPFLSQSAHPTSSSSSSSNHAKQDEK